MSEKMLITDVEVWEPVRSVPVPATSTSRNIIKTAGALIGWSLRETTGSAAASVDIYDGNTNEGTKVASMAMASGGDDHIYMGPFGIPVRTGLYLDVVSGSVAGAVWVRIEE